jgi:hypothetical protein
MGHRRTCGVPKVCLAYELRRCPRSGVRHHDYPCPCACSISSSSGSAAGWSCSAGQRPPRMQSCWCCGTRSPCSPRQSAAPAGLGRPRSPYRADPAPAASAADAPTGHPDSHQLVADDPSRPLTAAQLSKTREIIDIATVQSRYNLTDRSEQQMVDICEHEGMAFISWAPMAQGGLDQTAKPSLICASRVRAE